MRKLILLVLALVLFIPTSARAGAVQHYYVELNAYCQQDADRHDIYIAGATFAMWTDLERVKRMIVVFKEYHDYGHITGDNRWILHRSTRDIAHRSIGGVDIYGWFGHGGYYDVRWDPTSFDVAIDLVATWKGRDGVVYHRRIMSVAEKRDGGPCLSYSEGGPPPRP